MGFFDDELFLRSPEAKAVYEAVRDLPIIDYHCHLDPKKIAGDAAFSDIGELWLAGDHYKWRAMRLCGVDERLITGDADYKDKFFAYAAVLPRLAGNPLYYWTHLELKMIFGVAEPLDARSAPRIYDRANERLKEISVGSLLRQFRVEYIATTDDPCDDLTSHGRFGGTTVAPTFRPDKLLSLDSGYLDRLAKLTGHKIETVADLLRAAETRLLFFKGKECRLSDHGFACYPARCAREAEAQTLFSKRDILTAAEREALVGYLLTELMKLYKKHDIIVQLHADAARNVNPGMYRLLGPDAGFDVIGSCSAIEDVSAFLAQLADEDRPETILYTLNDSNLPALACLTGAFRQVRLGAAWWFNDTVEGIRRNLSVAAEYSALGASYGMLTDSRSFSSYVRFDFFRRILADYLGGLVAKGEFDASAAETLARVVCYDNIKGALGL